MRIRQIDIATLALVALALPGAASCSIRRQVTDERPANPVAPAAQPVPAPLSSSTIVIEPGTTLPDACLGGLQRCARTGSVGHRCEPAAPPMRPVALAPAPQAVNVCAPVINLDPAAGSVPPVDTSVPAPPSDPGGRTRCGKHAPEPGATAAKVTATLMARATSLRGAASEAASEDDDADCDVTQLEFKLKELADAKLRTHADWLAGALVLALIVHILASVALKFRKEWKEKSERRTHVEAAWAAVRWLIAGITIVAVVGFASWGGSATPTVAMTPEATAALVAEGIAADDARRAAGPDHATQQSSGDALAGPLALMRADLDRIDGMLAAGGGGHATCWPCVLMAISLAVLMVLSAFGGAAFGLLASRKDSSVAWKIAMRLQRRFGGAAIAADVADEKPRERARDKPGTTPFPAMELHAAEDALAQLLRLLDERLTQVDAALAKARRWFVPLGFIRVHGIAGGWTVPLPRHDIPLDDFLRKAQTLRLRLEGERSLLPEPLAQELGSDMTPNELQVIRKSLQPLQDLLPRGLAGPPGQWRADTVLALARARRLLLAAAKPVPQAKSDLADTPPESAT